MTTLHPATVLEAVPAVNVPEALALARLFDQGRTIVFPRPGASEEAAKALVHAGLLATDGHGFILADAREVVL